MVDIIFSPDFKSQFKKIKDTSVKEVIKKQLKKISKNPSLGKPMRYSRKGTRELYVSSFRLSYCFSESCITILAIYHKDKQ